MGNSRGEKREAWIAPAHYPDGTYTNPAQKAVDVTRNTVTDVQAVFTPPIIDRRTGETRSGGYWTVVERRTGGEWVQIKSLPKPIIFNGDGTPDLAEITKRVGENIDLAIFKADSQITSPEAKAHWSMDGDKYQLHLENPDKFEVFVEVPGFERLTAAEQTAVREAAAAAVTKHAAGWEFKVPSSVRIEAPVPAADIGTLPVTPPPAPIRGPVTGGATPGELAEIAGVARAREVFAREGAAASPERGFIKAGDVVFLLVTIGQGVYIYTKAPDGERVAALGSFGLDSLFNLAVTGVISRLVSGAAGVGVGFTVGLASDNGTDPEQEDMILQLVQRLYPEATSDEEFQRRTAQVRHALKEGKPVDFSDDPVPIVRTFEPMKKVFRMDEKDFVQADVVGTLDSHGAKELGQAAGRVGEERMAAIRAGDARLHTSLGQAARGLAGEQVRNATAGAPGRADRAGGPPARPAGGGPAAAPGGGAAGSRQPQAKAAGGGWRSWFGAVSGGRSPTPGSGATNAGIEAARRGAEQASSAARQASEQSANAARQASQQAAAWPMWTPPASPFAGAAKPFAAPAAPPLPAPPGFGAGGPPAFTVPFTPPPPLPPPPAPVFRDQSWNCPVTPATPLHTLADLPAVLMFCPKPPDP